jgi:hypothetical protein
VLAELLPRGGQALPTSLKALREATADRLALNVDLDRMPADGVLPGGEA